MGLSLLSALQGAGSQAAQASGTAAAGSASDLATQGTNINTGVGAATATVAEGAAEMAGIAAQFMSTIAALGPSLVTPMGQVALLGAGVQSGLQAAATTAKTKGKLAGHSAQMAQAGTPVQVAAAPTGGGSTSVLSELGQLLGVVQPLMQLAQPLMQLAQQGITSAATQQAAGAVAKPVASSNIDDKDKLGLAASAMAAGVAAGGIGGGGVAATEPTLTQWNGEKVGNTGADLEASELLAGESMAVAGEPVAPMAPVAPMGAGMVSRNAELAHSSSHQVLVNAAHGNEVVGEVDDVAPAVVGGADWQSDSPDIALTL
jgi:hypothetical protein